MSLIKKPVLWNCALQVQLYISLPDDIFEIFLQKQNHSLVPLTFYTINRKRWYILEKRCYREIRKTLKNTGILAALKIVKIGIHSLCSHIFRFNGPSLHNICRPLNSHAFGVSLTLSTSLSRSHATINKSHALSSFKLKS